MSSPVPGDTEDLHDRSLGELLKQLSEQTTRLVHQELELAKAELQQKGRQAGMGAGMFGGAGALGLAALGALTACFILALDAIMPAWLAALIVAVVYGIIAFVLVKQGQSVCRCGLEEERNRLSIEIPTWMFEAGACGQLRVLPVPAVSGDALTALQV